MPTKEERALDLIDWKCKLLQANVDFHKLMIKDSQMRQKLLDLEKRYELFEKTIADIKHRNNSKGFKTLLDHHKNPSAKAQSHKAAGNEYETSRSLNIPTSQLGQNPLSKTDDALNQPNFDKIRGDPEDEGKGRDTKLAADEDRE